MNKVALAAYYAERGIWSGAWRYRGAGEKEGRHCSVCPRRASPRTSRPPAGRRHLSSRTWFDTSSGQLHVKRGVLGITYSDEVRDTDFSRMYRRLVGEPAAPQWRFAYGLAHGVLGYGRECGSAPVSDAKLFADLLADDTFTDAARRKILTAFVDLARKREDEKIQWYWRVVLMRSTPSSPAQSSTRTPCPPCRTSRHSSRPEPGVRSPNKAPPRLPPAGASLFPVLSQSYHSYRTVYVTSTSPLAGSCTGNSIVCASSFVKSWLFALIVQLVQRKRCPARRPSPARPCDCAGIS